MGAYKQAMIAAGDKRNRPPTHDETLNEMIDRAGLRDAVTPEIVKPKIACGQGCGWYHDTVAEVRSCKGVKSPDPIDYYDGCKAGRCGQCGGTGRFITGMLNGKLVGPGGICYRCEGKGSLTCCTTEQHRERMTRLAQDDVEADEFTACCYVVRNDLYDRFGRRIYIG